MHEVIGSIPLSSTNFKPDLWIGLFLCAHILRFRITAMNDAGAKGLQPAETRSASRMRSFFTERSRS